MQDKAQSKLSQT